MKAVALTGIRRMTVQDIPEPEIRNDTDVLLKIERVGVCGSDVHYFETGHIGDQVIRYPFIVGHECAATVVETGSAVRRVKPGDRVAVDPAIACFACDQCRAGREHTCRNLLFLGCPGQVPGCLCEMIVMPEASCFALQPSVSLVQAVLSEPLAIAVYAVQRAAVTSGMQAGILGAGPIGLSCLVCARAAGADISAVTDLIAPRLQAARAQGAAWTGNPEQEDIVALLRQMCPEGLDVMFECAGRQQTVDQALELLKPGGKLLLIGIPREEHISIDIHKARRKEITLINVRRQNQCTQTALDWICQGKVQVDFMKTHAFAMDRTQQAFELVSVYRDGVIKAIIEF